MRRRRFISLAGAAVCGGAAVATGRRLIIDDDDDSEEVDDPRAGLQRIIRTIETDRPLAALTFDDGPHPALTPQILDLLQRRGIRATFMAVGHAALQHPDLLANVVAAGHELGHHSWRHINLARATVDQTREEIEVGARMVEDTAGVPIHLFRPPRGRLSEAALRIVARLRHDIVLWSVTRGALAWRSPQRIAEYVVDKVGPGDVIDLHDGIGRGALEPGGEVAHRLLGRRQAELAALPRILDEVAGRGIQLVTVSELLAAHRSPAEPNW